MNCNIYEFPCGAWELEIYIQMQSIGTRQIYIHSNAEHWNETALKRDIHSKEQKQNHTPILRKFIEIKSIIEVSIFSEGKE